MANVSVPSRVMLVGSWSRFQELVPGLEECPHEPGTSLQPVSRGASHGHGRSRPGEGQRQDWGWREEVEAKRIKKRFRKFGE